VSERMGDWREGAREDMPGCYGIIWLSAPSNL